MKNRRLKSCLLIVGIFAVGFFLLPLFLRVGYCQSWWGKENLVFRSLWLCTCSKEFEQSLYPDNVEVLASACDCAEGRFSGTAKPRLYFGPFPAVIYQTCEASPGVHRVPGNQFVQVGNQLINLDTGKTRPFFPPPGTGIEPKAWVTNDLIWMLNRGDYYLYRLSDQASLLIPDLRDLNQGQVDTPGLVNALKRADQVWVVEYSGQTKLIGLGKEIWQNPENNFFYNFFLLPEEIYKPGVEKFLNDNSITYRYIGGKYTTTSPAGRWIAKSDGVYNFENGEKVFDFGVSLPHTYPYTVLSRNASVNFYPIQWRGDEQAVILTASPLIGGGDLDGTKAPPIIPLFALPYLDDGAMTGILFSVPQPVLKVSLPEEMNHQGPQK